MSRRGELTDDQWAKLEPLLPKQKGRRGRPRKDDRTVINGILWIMRTGAPWRDLPERYGPWQTVSSRFYRWEDAGLWKEIFDALRRTGDKLGRIDWEIHHVDGTIVRAHQHAGGAKKGIYPEKLSDGVEEDSAPRSTSAATRMAT